LVVWDIRTTRILRKYKLENKVIDSVEWSPSKVNCILAATNEEHVYILQPRLYSKKLSAQTAESMKEWEKQYNIDVKASDQKEKYAKWIFGDDTYGSR